MTAVLVSGRNAFYSLRLSPLLCLAGWQRAGAAQLVIDESAAMAVAQESEADGRFAFWSTGWSVFILWNVATIAGALGARALPDPKVVGLDAAAPAAFLALMAPRTLSGRQLRVAAASAAAALAAVPLVPNGVPVLIAAAVAMGVAAAPLVRQAPQQ